MAISTGQLLLLKVVLLVQMSNQYSFENCIGAEYSKNETFVCKSATKAIQNLSNIVGDLPESATNISILGSPIIHIPTGSFQHLVKLETLSMHTTALIYIDGLAFQSLHHLKTLNLSYNYLSKLNCTVFQDLDNLTSLSLEHNNLIDLPERIFINTPHLNTLILRKNYLNNFSVIVQSISALKNLTQLDLCYNNLTSLSNSNIELPKSLTTLYVCGNRLSVLACTGSLLTHVTRLDLSHNFELSTNAFKGVNLTKIRYLQMRSTKVEILEFLNVTNIKAGYVDYSGVGLTNASLIDNLCMLLRERVGHINRMILVNNSISEFPNDTLSNCPKILKTLDISQNNLRTVECLEFLKGQKHIQILKIEHNHIHTLRSCKNTIKLPVTALTFRYNRIFTVDKYAFAHTPNVTILDLNINTIANFDLNALRGLTQLQNLRLDNNLITDLYPGTFQDQSSLKSLDLRNNRIAVIFNDTFLQLSQLTMLNLGCNKITHFAHRGLEGLKSLTHLYLDGNNLKTIPSQYFTAFQNTLQVLNMQKNIIRFFKDVTVSPFEKLHTLNHLNLEGQRPYGMSWLPHGFFRGLNCLRTLILSTNSLYHLASDSFDDLRALHFLTLAYSGYGVQQLEPGLFKNLGNLTKLSVENMGIPNLSKDVFRNLTRLRILKLNQNAMQSIDVDVLNKLSIEYLDIRNIPLSCSCQNEELQKWTLNKHVQVIHLQKLLCQENKSVMFIHFDTDVCFINIEMYLFFTTSALIFLFSIVPLLHVKLYWKMKYGYYVFRAWFSEQWRKLREDEEKCEYDAFISYNFHDEHWVLEKLLPNLEGNGSSFKLCLHQRDFEPGRNILDNIVSAVYGSRKTVCVVSRSFLQSEWCSLEIQLASYRLFDESRDVLLLVFLEHISESELSSYHRMRKVMLKKTYLQWPGSECTDPAPAELLFWKQLRRALRAGRRKEEAEELRENQTSMSIEGDHTAYSVDHS